MFQDASSPGAAVPSLANNIQAAMDLPRSATTGRPDPSRARTEANQDRRKQTLLTILDALQELSTSNDLNGTNPTTGSRLVEEDSQEPAADTALQNEGGEAFNLFQQRIKDFDKALRNFANQTRQLGSSAGILNSTFHLRSNLSQILFLFHENAADLFPRKVKKPPREPHLNDVHLGHGGQHQRHNSVSHKEHKDQTERKERASRQRHFDIRNQLKKIHKHNPHLFRSTHHHDLDPEDLPALFKTFAKELQKFLERLNEFPEFNDEAVNASFEAFEGDLRYWASTLSEFEGQLRFPSVGRYIHDLSTEMGEHLDNITASVAFFIDHGVPMIRFVQKHGATNLLNLSTVATFFSAVTATTIQFSYADKGTPIKDAVNTFWFASLVFSIASAVNSLLGLTWKQAMYRSPGDRVPWWVLIWIKRSPLIFLVISVAAFSMGLVLFAWSSDQSRATAIVTSVFTCLSSFGLIAVSLWFASERWAYSHHRGQRWLADVLAELAAEIRKRTGMVWLGKVHSTHVAPATRNATNYVRRFSKVSRTYTRDEEQGHDGPILPFAGSEIPLYQSPIQAPISSPLIPTLRRETSEPPAKTITIIAEPTGANGTIADPEKIGLAAMESIDGLPKDEIASLESPQHTNAKAKWTRAARMALNARTLGGAGSETSPIIPPVKQASRRQMTLSTSSTAVGPGRSRQESLEPVVEQRHERMGRLVTGLQNLTVADEMHVHQALVRHLQFSHDGKYLATCSWDRTSHLFRTFGEGGTELCSHHKKFFHPSGAGGQVAWSPDGRYLLTKLIQSVKVWSTEDGQCQITIRRPRPIQSLVWMPIQEGKEPSFMSVETGAVCTIDLKGNTLATYELERLQIYDVVVTPDAERFLGVAALLESKDKLKPAKSRPENRIIVYNLEEKSIESQVPVLNEVRDITLGGKDGEYALISYENMAPPQLWKLQMVRDDVRLVLTHTYMPQNPVLWAGSSYFGGKDDQLVLCAGKAGDVHIWDRETGRELHSFRTQDQSSGDLTAMAWNPLSEGTLMLATGTHDGILKIWTAEVPQRGEVTTDQQAFIQAASRSSSPGPMFDDEERMETPTGSPPLPPPGATAPASPTASQPDENGLNLKAFTKSLSRRRSHTVTGQSQSQLPPQVTVQVLSPTSERPASAASSEQDTPASKESLKRPLSVGFNRLGSRIRYSYFGGKDLPDSPPNDQANGDTSA